MWALRWSPKSGADELHLPERNLNKPFPNEAKRLGFLWWAATGVVVPERGVVKALRGWWWWSTGGLRWELEALEGAELGNVPYGGRLRTVGGV